MNKGEKNELLFKLYLCELKRKKDNSTILKEINFLGIDNLQYITPEVRINFASLNSNEDIKNLCKKLNIDKSSPRNKSDININGINYSLKYLNAAPPALLNHTNRIGFLRVAELLQLNISELDSIISKYWDLRINGIIKEDCLNSDHNSPFASNKDILRPYLEYFFFSGTGSSDSIIKADKVLKFSEYNNPSTWKVLNKSDTIDEIWDNLIFSLRSKGMPEDYNNYPLKDKISSWTKLYGSKYRGSIHIRYKFKN